MQDDLNTAAALGAIFELVRALNSAIDAGEIGTGDVPASRDAFDEFDQRARRAQRCAAPRTRSRRCRSTRSSGSSRIATPRAAAATSPRPTASATTWRHAACCSKTRRRHTLEAKVRRQTRPSAVDDSAPHIKTPLPGPKAQGDHRRATARSCRRRTRAAIRWSSRAGRGAMVEDVDGNVFLDCAAGIAVNSTGHSHPDVVKAITEQAQKFLHMSGTDFYYEPQVRLAEELARSSPIAGRRAIVLRQLGHRGDRGGAQAGALRDRAPEHHRVSRRLPRPHAWARSR